jgi:hypothetical protein
MTEEEYRARVLQGLAEASAPAIATALGDSQGYAARLSKGETVPHPRHWAILATMVDPP